MTKGAEAFGTGDREKWATVEHLSDKEWARVAEALDGRTGAMARNGGNTRRFVNAVIWMARTHAFWSDLPPSFGNWHTVHVRYLRWLREDRWPAVVAALNKGAAKNALQRMVRLYADRERARIHLHSALPARAGKRAKAGTGASA